MIASLTPIAPFIVAAIVAAPALALFWTLRPYPHSDAEQDERCADVASDGVCFTVHSDTI